MMKLAWRRRLNSGREEREREESGENTCDFPRTTRKFITIPTTNPILPSVYFFFLLIQNIMKGRALPGANDSSDTHSYIDRYYYARRAGKIKNCYTIHTAQQKARERERDC
jgi:hypothetical protein